MMNSAEESRLGRLVRLIREDYSSFGRLVEQIREDYHASHRDWTMPGFRAVAVHRIGNWAWGLQFRPVRGIVSRIYRLLYIYVRNHYTIELPRTTSVGRRLTIGHQGGIVIHPFSKIGDDCIIRQNVTLGAGSPETVERAPVLMNRVEVGCGAVIVGGIVIGDDVRIGPNAVVTMNVPAGSTVVVLPPRIVQFKKPATPPRAAPAAAVTLNDEPVPQ